MNKIKYKPKNKEYFSKLLSFAKELYNILNELKIKPTVYGSLAYIFYTEDKNIEIHDIDFLTKKENFQKIIKKVKENKSLRYEKTNYNSLKIFKNDAKITFDAIEEYYKDLPEEFIEIEINEVPFKIISLESLKKIYKRGNITIPSKKESYSKKLEKLNSL